MISYKKLEELYLASLKECDELRNIVEKQFRMNRSAAVLALELDTVTAERDALAADNKRLNEAPEAMRRDLESMARLMGV